MDAGPGPAWRDLWPAAPRRSTASEARLHSSFRSLNGAAYRQIARFRQEIYWNADKVPAGKTGTGSKLLGNVALAPVEQPTP